MLFAIMNIRILNQAPKYTLRIFLRMAIKTVGPARLNSSLYRKRAGHMDIFTKHMGLCAGRFCSLYGHFE